MKNTTLKIILLLLGFCLVSLLLSEFSSETKLRVSDERWQWIRYKIFRTPHQTVDYVVIGSSLSWCAIKPSLISSEIPGTKIWNLGRNWQGRDADYFIIEHLLQRHRVRNLLVEFCTGEPKSPHAYVPYIILPHDAWGKFIDDFNQLKPSDILKYSQFFKEVLVKNVTSLGEVTVRPCLQLFQRKNFPPDLIIKYDLSQGFYHVDSEIIQDPAFFEKFKNQPEHQPRLRPDTDFPGNPYARFYFEKIKELASRYNVRLYFVFVPIFNVDLPDRSTYRYLSQIGDVLIPNIHGLYKMSYWRNDGHLFQKGSEVYTYRLIELLKKGKEASPHFGLYGSLK